MVTPVKLRVMELAYLGKWAVVGKLRNVAAAAVVVLE
jgi:hypothetical protein